MENNEKLKKDYEAKVKKTIQLLFKQMKTGCYRLKCYNKYCKKSYSYNYEFTNDKTLISDCLAIVKKSDNLTCLICLDLSEIKSESLIVKSFDDWIGLFELKESNTLDLALVDAAISKKGDSKPIDVFLEIDSFIKSYNQVFHILMGNQIIKKANELTIEFESTDEEFNKSITEYFYRIFFNFINILLMSKDFMYNLSIKKHLESLLYEFIILKNTYTSFYGNSKVLLPQFGFYDKEHFTVVISNLQNFLTVLLVDLTTQEMESSVKELLLLVCLMRIFEIFFSVNEEYKFIPKEGFHNDSVNNYLSIKFQCSNYFKYHKFNKQISIIEEAQIFSFIKYYFTYDTASKKEIISHYNTKMQNQEIFSSFESFEALLLGSGGPYLVFNVRREQLVDNTLDIISGNLNFRKPLKVRRLYT